MFAVTSAREPTRQRVALDPADAVWLAAVPAAAIVLVAVVLFGPPLGALVFPPSTARFWPSLLEGGIRREPSEQARYLIALSAPFVLAGLTLALSRGVPRGLAHRRAALARAAEAAAVALVAACFVAQRLQLPQTSDGQTRPVVYFTWASIAVAIAIGAGLTAAARSARARARFTRWTAETRGRRLAALLVAVVVLVVALLPAINTDASIAQAYEEVVWHLEFTYDETVAVLNGRSPLGDFTAQYASLWPYGLAAGMSLLGDSLLAFTALMAALTGATLLALFGVLRRVTRSSLAALALFLPLLATFGFRLHGPPVNRFSLINYFGVQPLRTAGPFLLAWLLARHLDGARPRRVWPLFLVGGLVALNNTDFGLAALAATVAALAWSNPRPAGEQARRGVAEALGGLAAAYALVAALLLARTGSLPELGRLVAYARLYAVEGFSMLPIRPLFGVALALFLTHVAAVGVATVRALRSDPDRLLTGLLTWSGVFGLGAGAYYVGHSLSELVTYMFPMWALTVVLLTVAVLAPAPGRIRPAAVACLVAFGLLVCSLAQLPAPWQQLERIRSHDAPAFARPIGQELVAERTRPGERVLIMAPLSHRIAQTLQLDNVAPYSDSRSILTLEQLEESLAALRAAGGTKVFVTTQYSWPGLTDALARTHRLVAQYPTGMELWQRR
ncbi:MAG TPA: hypothetical protein VFS37_12425 [Conexibacter sp.]|nr:hypothetical protein [Conexibacter sp.]